MSWIIHTLYIYVHLVDLTITGTLQEPCHLVSCEVWYLIAEVRHPWPYLWWSYILGTGRFPRSLWRRHGQTLGWVVRFQDIRTCYYWKGNSFNCKPSFDIKLYQVVTPQALTLMMFELWVVRFAVDGRHALPEECWTDWLTRNLGTRIETGGLSSGT